MASEAKGTGPKKQSAAAGQPQAMSLATIDLSRELPELWQRAFDASPDLISIHDTHHRILAVNKAMAGIMGRTAQELQGRQCHDVVHDLNCPPLACPHRMLIQDGREHQMEIYEQSIDTWLLVTVNPLYDKDQRLIGSIHIARNINAQKKDQQALQESEERFQQLSEATMDGVLLSEDSVIILTNRVLADMLGYTMQELVGMKLFKLVARRQRERLIQYLREQQTGIYEFECVKKDGTRFPIQAHARAVTYNNKLVYQTAIRDLTEQKKMQAERTRHERLQGVLQTAGAICHEINQPLTALYGYLDLLAAYLASDHPAVRKIRKIEEQTGRIEKIVHQLMHITQYKTKAYAGGEKIIDIDQSADDLP